jgi:hypothetical protein
VQSKLAWWSLGAQFESLGWAAPKECAPPPDIDWPPLPLAIAADLGLHLTSTAAGTAAGPDRDRDSVPGNGGALTDTLTASSSSSADITSNLLIWVRNSVPAAAALR